MDGEKGGCPGRDAGMGEQNKWVTGKKKRRRTKGYKEILWNVVFQARNRPGRKQPLIS